MIHIAFQSVLQTKENLEARTFPDTSVQFSSVQWLSPFQLFATPWTAALQVSLSIPNSRSLPKLTSVESVMPSKHLILYYPLLLPPSMHMIK